MEWEDVMNPKWDESSKRWADMRKDQWDDAKCFLQKLGWIKDDWEVQTETIKTDMPKLAAPVGDKYDICYKESDDGDDETEFLRYFDAFRHFF